MTPRFHRGFTLIEVLVASAVLATISAGLLATTWRFARFAREQTEHMIANSISHDLLMAVHRMKYEDIESVGSKDAPVYFPSNALPWIVVRGFTGERHIRPLWRDENRDENVDSEKQPCFWLDVGETVKDDVTNKVISSTIRWWSPDENTFRTNCMTVVRVNQKWDDAK